MHKSILAFIPAREGSKGLKFKNFKLIKNKPLINYTVDAALKSKIFSEIVISTDHSNTIKNFKDYKNIQIHNRPKKLSNDKSLVIEALKHFLKNNYKSFEYIMILQPTSPLRKIIDIRKSYFNFIKSNADTLVSVYRVDDHHPSRMYEIKKQLLKPLDAKNYSKRRQDLSEIYHRNGAIYLFKNSNLKENSIYGKKIIPYIMPINRSLNIDNKIDFELAKILLK